MGWLHVLFPVFFLFRLTTSGTTTFPEAAKAQPAGSLAAVLTQQWMRWTGLDNIKGFGAPLTTKIHHQMVPEKRLGSFDLPNSKPSRMMTPDHHRQGLFYHGIVEEEPGSENYLPPAPSHTPHHSEFPPDLRDSPNYYGSGPNYPPRPAYDTPYPPPEHGYSPQFEETQYSPQIVQGTFGRPLVLDSPRPQWQSKPQFPKPIPPFSSNSDMFKGFHDTRNNLIGSPSIPSPSSGSQSLWQVVDVATAMKPSASSTIFQQHHQQMDLLEKSPPRFGNLRGHRVIDTLDPAFLAWALHRTKNGQKMHNNRQNQHRPRRPVVVVVTGTNLPSSVLADHSSLGGALGGRNNNQNGGQVLLHVDLDKSTIKAITPHTLQQLGLTANARPATTIHLHRPPGLGHHSFGGFGSTGLFSPGGGGGFNDVGSSGFFSSGGGFGNHDNSNFPGFTEPNLSGSSFGNSGQIPPPHSFIPSSLTAGSGKPNSSPFPISGGMLPSGMHDNDIVHQSEFGSHSSLVSDVLHQGSHSNGFGINGFQDGPTPFTNPNDLGSIEPFSELIDDDEEEWSVFPLPSLNFLGSGSGGGIGSSSSPFGSIFGQSGAGSHSDNGGIFGGGGHSGLGGIFGGGHSGAGGIFGGGGGSSHSGGGGGIFGNGLFRPLGTLRPIESKRLRELLGRILKPFAARYKLVIGPSGLEPSAFIDKRAEKRTGDQKHPKNATNASAVNDATNVVTTVIANVTELNGPISKSSSVSANSTTLLDGDLRTIITPRR